IPPTPSRETSTRTAGRRNVVVSDAVSGAWASAGLAAITLQVSAVRREHFMAHSGSVRTVNGGSGCDVTHAVAGRELAVPVDVLVDHDELHHLAGAAHRDQAIFEQP